MSTATKLRPKEQTGTGSWSAIFPTEQVTAQQSTLFVKKLLAVAISNITYLRAIFPEHAFGDRCLEDLNLKILRDDSTCPGSCQVINWVKGCFDALERKFLRMIVIGIYADVNDPDTVIESYTFKFSYRDNGGIDIFRNNEKITSAYSAAETKKATIRLLRTIVVLTQSLQSLPDEVMMTMRLLYYDDVTPSDYEPPGFVAARSDAFKFDEEPMNIKIGDVDTPFHTVKLRIKTDAKQFQMTEDEEQTAAAASDEETQMIEDGEQHVTDQGLDREDDDLHSQAERVYEFREEEETTQMMSPMEERRIRRVGPQEVPEPSLADDVPGNTPARPDSAVYQETPASVLSHMTVQDDYGVRCPCGCNEDDGLMILCSVCHHWQHGVCFMILQEEDAPSRHVCDMCTMPNDPELAPTDPNLCGKTEITIQAICLWRRTLLACKETNRILAPGLAKRLGCEVTVAKGIITRLVNESVVKASPKGKRLGKVVDQEKLQECLKKYFKRESDDEDMTQDPQVRPQPVITSPQEEQKVPEKKPKEDISVDQQIDKLADRAHDISLTGHRRSGRSTPAQKPSQSEKAREPQRTRGKKRAKSVLGEEEYDVSYSQDVSQAVESDEVPKRKKKASLAEKALLV